MINQYKLVLPEHLNHYGYLFGGNMLKWADEYSWIGRIGALLIALAPPARHEFPGK